MQRAAVPLTAGDVLRPLRSHTHRPPPPAPLSAAARELFQQGIWAAPPRARATCLVFQAWAMLERDAGGAACLEARAAAACTGRPQHALLVLVLQQHSSTGLHAGCTSVPCTLHGRRASRAPTLLPPPPPPHAGNLSLARELLKCAVKADPKSEASWLVWAQMEEDLGYYQRASELRSYSMQVGGIAVVALLRAEGYFQRASEQRSYSMQAQQ